MLWNSRQRCLLHFTLQQQQHPLRQELWALGQSLCLLAHSSGSQLCEVAI